MKLRTLYLQKRLSISGRDALIGRRLYDLFRNASADILLGHLVLRNDEFAGVPDHIRGSDFISESLLREFDPNVVYLEGGLFADRRGKWKIPQDMLQAICEKGGIILIADAGYDTLIEYAEHYRAAAKFLGASARYRSIDDDNSLVYGLDSKRFWQGHREILCDPRQMVVDDWLRPIYQDIPQILVGAPVALAEWGSVVASCNKDTTGTLSADVWVDRVNPCIFASTAQRGTGFVTLIAGHVSSDTWLEQRPDNGLWLTRMARHLRQQADEDRQRKASHLRSRYTLFLSHRSLDREIVSKAATALKQQGLRVWIDHEQLVPSQSLIAEITAALGKMTHFVLFWSQHCPGALG